MKDPTAAYHSPVLGEGFGEALTYAARLHRDQRRKGTQVPYVAHLLAVTALVLEHGGSESEAIAALLHDAVEDRPRDGVTESEIESRFGREVLDTVLACTDTSELTGGRTAANWRVRKEKYLDALPHHSCSALLVSAADKLHNARTILADLKCTGDSTWERFRAPRDQQLWYYRGLVNAFRKAPEAPIPLIDSLDETVAEMEELAGA